MLPETIPLVALVPGLVELAKRAGLPVRFAGVCAIISATALVILVDLMMGPPLARQTIIAIIARWLVTGVMVGLASAGLYTQVRLVGHDDPSPGVSQANPRDH